MNKKIYPKGAQILKEVPKGTVQKDLRDLKKEGSDLDVFQGEKPGEHGQHPQHRGLAQPGQVQDEQVRLHKKNIQKNIQKKYSKEIFKRNI